jgi:hypothetical protein
MHDDRKQKALHLEQLLNWSSLTSYGVFDVTPVQAKKGTDVSDSIPTSRAANAPETDTNLSLSGDRMRQILG